MFDSPGFTPQRHVAAQPLVFTASDQASFLDSFRNELSTQLKRVYDFEQAAEPLWTVPQPEQTDIRTDLSVVAEERSDDEAIARDVEECGEDSVAGRVYSCDHCHCAVCKRSLELHDCQHSASSLDHEVASDDAGGSVPSTVIYSLLRLLLAFCC